MMTNSIGISVTGGNANIGNVQQGDANRASAGALSISTGVDEAFADLFATLDERRARQPDQPTEIDALKAELAALQQAVKTGKPTRWGSIADTAKILYEKFGWAGGLLKKLFVVLVPGWLP